MASTPSLEAPKAPPASGASGAYWVCQVVGWGTYATVTVFQFFAEDDGVGAARAIIETLFAASFGIALTHAFRRYVKRKQWAELGVLALLPRIVGATITLACVHVAALVVIEIGGYGDRPESPTLMALSAVFRWSTLFFTWVALYFGHALIRQRFMARKQLELAQLRSLKAQLHPHFLFNALNSVRALIRDEPTRAEDAVTHLARMLRYTLSSGQQEVVSIEQELATVGDYLALEELRLGSRLRIEREVAPSAAGSSLPTMLLLLLVENAVKHGISELPEGGVLGLRAERLNGSLLVEVRNPCPPGHPGRGGRVGGGIGLANARERLRLLFGAKGELTFELAGHHALAKAKIPQP